MIVRVKAITEYESFNDGMRALLGDHDIAPADLLALISSMLEAGRPDRVDRIILSAPKETPAFGHVPMTLEFYNDYVE